MTLEEVGDDTGLEDTLVGALETHGALILRRLLPLSVVQAVRDSVLSHLVAHGFSSPEGKVLRLGPSLLSRQEDLCVSEEMEALLFHPRLTALLSSLYAYQSSSSSLKSSSKSSSSRRRRRSVPFEFDLSALPSEKEALSTTLYNSTYPLSCMPYKWLRAVSRGQHTGIHMDKVYFPRHSALNLLTLWIPLGNLSPHQGSLIFIPGSHTSPAFQALRDSYGNSSVGPDGTLSGWLQPSALEGLSDTIRWEGGEYAMGDVVVLGLETLHQTTPNETDSWRLSVESRWMDPSLLPS
jgi:hypothetical protein